MQLTREADTFITIQMEEEEILTFIIAMVVLQLSIKILNGLILDPFNQSQYSKSNHQVQY